MMDIDYQLFGNDPQTVLIIFFVCHLIGLCSTLFNPIVYCYWNEGFKREFWAIVTGLKTRAKVALECYSNHPAEEPIRIGSSFVRR